MDWFFPCSVTAHSEPQPPHCRGFTITMWHTVHTVGLLWTGDQSDAETSAWQHTTLKTDWHSSGGIRTHNASKRAATDHALDRADIEMDCLLTDLFMCFFILLIEHLQLICSFILPCLLFCMRLTYVSLVTFLFSCNACAYLLQVFMCCVCVL
jgi:hypothetical protein